jgi:tetratricopeptide (TPR) repeat protein
LERTDGSSHLGRFIKECRTSLGYTSRKVEEVTRTRPGLSAISHSNLLAIEKGVHVPTFDKILTLSLIFNVPTSHFEDQLKRDMQGGEDRAPSLPSDSLLTLGMAALAEGEHGRALEHFIEAYTAALAEQARAVPEAAERLAEARLQAANCRARLGLVRIAKEDLEAILGDEATPPGIVVRANFLLAELHRELSNLRLALLHARAALDLVPASDPSARSRTLRAKFCNTLGNILDERGESPAALSAYDEAYRLFEQLGDRRACGLVARNIGETHLRRQDFPAATRRLEEGLAVARESLDRRGAAYGLVNLARVHFLQGENERARERAREAKDLAQAESYQDVLFSSTFYLWRISEIQGQPSLTRVFADRLAVLQRKLETRSAESDEWSRYVSESRRIRT